jgi:hypothetical protein
VRTLRASCATSRIWLMNLASSMIAPVINVNWDEAKIYVTWLAQQTGKPYRLLTEAEWEDAARARATTRYSFGDDVAELGQCAWFAGNSESRTHPIGEKKPNAFGVYYLLSRRGRRRLALAINNRTRKSVVGAGAPGHEAQGPALPFR